MAELTGKSRGSPARARGSGSRARRRWRMRARTSCCRAGARRCSRRPPAAIKKSGGKAEALAVDVSDRHAVATAAADIIARHKAPRRAGQMPAPIFPSGG